MLARAQPEVVEVNDEEKAEENPVVVLPKSRLTKENIATLGISLVGLTSAILFLKPSQTCVEKDECGKWLANATGDVAPWIFFLCGTIDFGGMNFFFAGDSIPRLLEFIHRQNSVTSAVIKTSLVMTFAATQIFEKVLTSLGTKAEMWQTALTVIGMSPGVLFASVNIAENDLPFIARKISEAATGLHKRAAACFYPLSEAEKQHRVLYEKQLKEQAVFCDYLKANWTHLLSQTDKLTVVEKKDFFNTLFNPLIEPKEKSALNKFGKGVTYTLATMMAAVTATPLVNNVYNQLEKFIPDSELLRALTTAGLSVSMSYTICKLVIHGAAHSYESLVNLISGDAQDWIARHTRPKTTAAALFVTLATSALSYAGLSALFENNYAGPYKDEMRIATIIGVDIYHVWGMLHLYDLSLQRLSQDEKEVFLFQLEKEKNRLLNLPLKDFVELQKTMHHLQADKLTEKEVEVLEANKPAAVKSTSYFSGWCSWFKCGKKARLVDLEDGHQGLLQLSPPRPIL